MTVRLVSAAVLTAAGCIHIHIGVREEQCD
jgi:hypothetical protein